MLRSRDAVRWLRASSLVVCAALLSACDTTTSSPAAPDVPLIDPTDVLATDTSATDTSATDVLATDTPATDTPAIDVLATDTPASDTSPSDTSPSDAPALDTSPTDTPATDTPASDVALDASVPDVSDATAPHDASGNPASVGTGARKTITIDGMNTGNEWGADTLLIRDPVADDARFLGTNWCAHEAPWDYAGLHAAWDDANLYIGIQYVNVTDVVDPSNLGSSNGSPIHALDLVQFVVFDTSSGAGYGTGGDMWGKDHTFVGADRPDYQLYFHSNFSQEGLYLGRWDGARWTASTNGRLTTALRGAGARFSVDGATRPGVDPHSDDSTPGRYATTVDYAARGHDARYDTFFELQIPLALLGLDAARLDRGTVGVFAGNGDGSGVDSVPDDPATRSTTGVSPSNSPLEWNPAVDDDAYAAPFALIGRR